MLFMILPHKLRIRHVVINVGMKNYGFRVGGYSQQAQRLKYEHQRAYLEVALKTI